MQITVSTQGFPLTASIRSHLRRRLHRALDQFDGRVRRIQVRLSDTNGRKGGVDKRCQLEMQLTDRIEVVVADRQPNLYDAVTRAVNRAAGTLSRKVGRVRQRQRGRRPARILSPDALPDHAADVFPEKPE